jgi:hypothetical protein
VTGRQLACHLRRVDAAIEEEYQEVVEEVGGLGDQGGGARPARWLGAGNRCHGGEGHLDPFLADLLGDAAGAGSEEPRGVALLGRCGTAALEDPVEPAQLEAGGVGLETGRGASVAGGALGMGPEEEGVAVAVGHEIDYAQHVTGGLALAPKGTARAAPEVGLARG